MRTFTLLVIISVLVFTSLSAFAAVPAIINYQGKLFGTDGKPIVDGAYSLQFAIYDVPVGGTSLWSETNAAVQVKDGLFSVLLGSIINLPANIFDAKDRFFGVQVGTDLEMTPRQQVASVPFAVKAGSADIATNVDDGAITTSKIADAAVTAAKIEAQEAWNEVGAGGKPAFQNGWLNYPGNEYSTTAYMRDSLGFVHIKGMVKGGSSAEAVVFTLPVGYRPSKVLRFVVDAHGTYGWANIAPSGDVYGQLNTIDTMLNGIVFRAEQ